MRARLDCTRSSVCVAGMDAPGGRNSSSNSELDGTRESLDQSEDECFGPHRHLLPIVRVAPREE